NVLGGETWIATPIDGLRFGGGGRRKDDYGGLNAASRGVARVVTDWNAGIDGHFDKWQVRTETDRITSRILNFRSDYVQLGLSPLPWFTLNVQSEFSDVHVAAPPVPMRQVSVNRDDAVGLY